jgi:hypothetical protein
MRLQTDDVAKVGWLGKGFGNTGFRFPASPFLDNFRIADHPRAGRLVLSPTLSGKINFGLALTSVMF